METGGRKGRPTTAGDNDFLYSCTARVNKMY